MDDYQLSRGTHDLCVSDKFSVTTGIQLGLEWWTGKDTTQPAPARNRWDRPNCSISSIQNQIFSCVHTPATPCFSYNSSPREAEAERRPGLLFIAVIATLNQRSLALFRLTLPVPSPSWRAVRAGAQAETRKENSLWIPPTSCLACFLVLPRPTCLGNGATHSRQGPPIATTKQDNLCKTWLWASMIWAIFQGGFLPPGDPRLYQFHAKR